MKESNQSLQKKIKVMQENRKIIKISAISNNKDLLRIHFIIQKKSGVYNSLASGIIDQRDLNDLEFLDLVYTYFLELGKLKNENITKQVSAAYESESKTFVTYKYPREELNEKKFIIINEFGDVLVTDALTFNLIYYIQWTYQPSNILNSNLASISIERKTKKLEQLLTGLENLDVSPIININNEKAKILQFTR